MQHPLSAKQVIAFILKMIRPFLFSIGIMFFVAIAWATDRSLRPYILKIILDRMTHSSSQDLISNIAGPATLYLLLSFFATGVIFRLYGYFVEIQMIPRLRKRIADLGFSSLLKQSYHFYQNQFAGTLSNKINDLLNAVPDFVQVVIDRFFSHFLAIVIALFVLWQVNSLFALLMLVWTSLLLMAAWFVSKRITKEADAHSEWGSIWVGRTVDALSNMLSIRLFAKESVEETTIALTSDKVTASEQKLQTSYSWMFGYAECSFFLVQSLTLIALIKGRQAGWISVGDFVLVLFINFSLLNALFDATRDFSRFSKQYGKITQALRTLLVKPEIQDKPHASALKVSQGQIVFEQVQFSYPNAEALFEDKSVIILPGQKVGLVGYSGSGKSTFVNLILRLFDVTSGRILIDGQNIQDVTQHSLRSAIGMIPQDPTLFHRTLAENIRYGNLEATNEAVILAAQKAYAHEFIIKLPQGYDSLVGERGIKLSGGQRQRIAIARAILKNAPILILDEATSQLDSVTESEIQASLWELMQNKTTLVIAHRLSTLLHMDRILVFDAGKIVEDGTHQNLLNQGGLYKTLWDAQVGGFLPDKKILEESD